MTREQEAEIKLKLSERDTLALTLWAEARSEPIEGLIAVAVVIRNRVMMPGRFGSGYKAVCLARMQFSCWNYGNDYNHTQLMRMAEAATVGNSNYDSQQLFRCRAVADMAIGNLLGQSIIRGATHYYAPDGMVPKGAVPAWAKGLKGVKVGTQLFFEGVK